MRLETCNTLCCPNCHGRLNTFGVTNDAIEEGALVCSSCAKEYPVRGGIPIFLDDCLTIDSIGKEFDSLDEENQCKVLQREWHDRERLDMGFKRAKYAAPSLFSYLLHYQFHNVEKVLSKKQYSYCANIGAGHGFELQFLARHCRNVLAVDISQGSLRLALALGGELGLQVEAVCADAEKLPLRDRSFDLVLAHHSLHHLSRPMRGLEEMTRISNHDVIFFEPAKGLTRTILTGLGLKPRTEESGNVVYEFSREEVEQLSSIQNFRLRYHKKCLVTGPADEPRWFKHFDSFYITPALCGAIALGNSLLGNVLGTKCTFVLERDAR